jgi:ABC-type sugar transport system substrate-binding protein
MTKRRLRTPVLAVCLLACVAGTAFAAVSAAPPPGEPTIPGVGYAAKGVGAPYLPTKGAPRRLSGYGIGPFGGTLQAKAIVAGTKAGKAAGKKITKPLGLKVGYLDIIGGIESADRADNAMRNAFQHLGAKWIYCDGAGNPTKWVSCGQSLLAQGVNVLAYTGIDPSSIPAVVSEAKAKGVPIVDCCGQIGPGAQAQFAPDEAYNGQVLAAYLKAKLANQPGTQDILSLDYPAPWATLRTDQLKALVAKDSHLKIALAANTDPTNLVAGTQKQVNDELTADPNLKAIWVSFDTVGQVAGQVVQSKFAGKTFPNKPLVVTFHADPSTQPLLASHAIDAVVDNNYDTTAWEVANAVAEKFARKTAFPAYTVKASYPGLGNPLGYQIVTGANLPPKGTYVRPAVDAVSYFIAKWKAEGFGK